MEIPCMAMQIDSRTGSPDDVPPGFGSAPAPVPFHVAAALLKGLNQEQKRAVKHGAGPLLVIAGPGTGKTEVVTRRVAWLIATKRARAHEILALTFTDNAAQEMQARVDLLVPYGQADTAIHTFHAFGDRLIREFAFELGLPGDARLLESAPSQLCFCANTCLSWAWSVICRSAIQRASSARSLIFFIVPKTRT